ncbi:MAG: 16S rRNA (adenine(1518)-N(6)/adenine(1519)-N(6))-dimethyltransferase RsmA [Nitrospinota bacterium]|nr:16S rRNA (adenine(1518)-N(6)/adenine(1519)-N(6))-dimethyltransferase RsmA [Nitrospinota bacterium]
MKKRRKWGQNFLADPEIAGRILDLANISPDDTVLEIGPGRGILTQDLIQRSSQLTVLEIDPALCANLRERFSALPNFHLIQADALKFDYSCLGLRFQVVSNLPYYAATHILKRLIHYRNRIHAMTVMLQKEVVDRLTAQPRQKEYGSLSVFIQYHCKVERALEVKKESFSPPPKIDSSVIRLTPLAQPKVAVTDERTFFKIVHAAFLHKRKMLKSNLKEWQKQFEVGEGKIKLAEIDLTRRGETLSLQDFALISNHICSKKE